MSQQSCRNCYSQYDYFERTATVICDTNHVVCRPCAIVLRQSNGTCPYCYGPMIGTQPQSYNNSPYWQANQNQGFSNNPQPYRQNQGYQAYQAPQAQQAQPYQPLVRTSNPFIFCGLSIVFLIVFIVLLIIRLQMDEFSSAMPGVMFGLFFSFFLTISFFMRFLAGRRRNQMLGGLGLAAPGGNYMRV